MAFDCIVTKKVTDELKNLKGYKISKINQPDKNTIVLGIYGNSINVAMLACISANNYRIHLTTHQPKNPLTALNFCMLLRKHILGYKIEDIYSEDFERIVYIKLKNDDNPDKPIYKTLVVELMGKHSNIILLNEQGIIIDSIRHTSIEENSQRDIYPTARYIKPKSSNYLDYILNQNPDIPKEKLEEKISDIMNAKNIGIKITKYKNEIPRDFELDFNYDKQKYDIFPLDFSLDDFYYIKENSEIFINYRNSILQLILATLKKYEKRLENIDDKLKQCDDMDKYRLYGELITANLYQITSKNADFVELQNYYDNNKIIKINLDKRYSPSVNAKRFFKKYNKLKNALEIVNEQKKDTINEINYIESIVFELENCKTIEDVQEIYNEISETDIFKLKKKEKKTTKKTKIKKMTTNKFAKFNPKKVVIDGYTIFIGRNNVENDYLTNKFAKKSDIWFHTKDIHGSHVILKTNPGEIVPDNILYQAAKLAAIHSKANGSSNIPVDYCEVRFVKKIPGNHPGLVIYSNNKTLYVDGS